MVVLFFNTHHDAPAEHEPDALPEKMRAILLTNVKEAKTPEEKERAQRELDGFETA